MRFIVTDARRDGSGDIFTEERETLQEAIKEADREWHYLTGREKEQRTIYVLESVNPDEDAPDHFDGNIVYSC